MKKFAMTMMIIGLTAMVAQAAATHFEFNETAPGTWDVLVTVTGADTLGLTQYSIWVYDTPGVSYVENRLSTFRPGDFATIGFPPGSMASVYIDGTSDFNASNIQWANEFAIQGIGMIPLQMGPPPPFPAPPPYDIDLGIPALLGTLTTPTGLGLPAGSPEGHDDFAATSANVLDLTGEGVIETVPTWEVNPIPEPATLSLLAIGGLALLRRRSAQVLQRRRK